MLSFNQVSVIPILIEGIWLRLKTKVVSSSIFFSNALLFVIIYKTILASCDSFCLIDTWSTETSNCLKVTFLLTPRTYQSFLLSIMTMCTVYPFFLFLKRDFSGTLTFWSTETSIMTPFFFFLKKNQRWSFSLLSLYCDNSVV